MKKTILFLIGLILAGTAAYFIGYFAYVSDNSEVESQEHVIVQKALYHSEKKFKSEEIEQYYVKIEQDTLKIYKMPEKILYESIALSSLHLSEKEKKHLKEGIILQDLKEVYEFLENSMS